MISKELTRCPWSGTHPLYIKYHDEEWGVPVHEEKKHFEFLTLESAQAGLSWLTVLRKRYNYCKAFEDFDPGKVSLFDEKKMEELLTNEGIIRNRLKIKAAIHNAKRFLEVGNEFGSFDTYIWQFVNNKPVINFFSKISEIPASTPLSDKIAGDLKKRDFKFVGTKIIYSHLQATGLVNDHLTSCFRFQEIIQTYPK
jgi:DNA-3-methyladenine glycosylase I